MLCSCFFKRSIIEGNIKENTPKMKITKKKMATWVSRDAFHMIKKSMIFKAPDHRWYLTSPYFFVHFLCATTDAFHMIKKSMIFMAPDHRWYLTFPLNFSLFFRPFPMCDNMYCNYALSGWRAIAPPLMDLNAHATILI